MSSQSLGIGAIICLGTSWYQSGRGGSCGSFPGDATVVMACNLCHPDRTLPWAADQLTDWYGQPRPELSDEERQVAASLLWLLSGDGLLGERGRAVQRAARSNGVAGRSRGSFAGVNVSFRRSSFAIPRSAGKAETAGIPRA